MEALKELLGDSPAIESVRETIRRLLVRQQPGRRLPAILIQGETGTGKGVVARLIHRLGPRAQGPFVDVNCAAIPDTLIEAELFGFERGAFTDARRAKPGLFQTAHRGTLFLDEVGLLPEALQAKLLTVIEERAVRRLGATQPEPADVWLISATNADLLGAVRARRFREDLYHRLAVLTVQLPPLRARGRDVITLAEQFLTRVCAEYGLPPRSLASDARARLMGYAWPGNVRELANVIERVALLADSPVITAELLELPVGPPPAEPAAAATVPPPSLDEAMREHLLSSLEQTGWNISRSAAALGISRNTLRARIERLGLRPGARPAAPPPRPAPAETAPRPSQPAPPAPVAGAAPMRWVRRRITLMRVVLTVPETPRVLSDASRVLETLIEKVQSFGGRVEGVSQTGIEASFGAEPVEDASRRAAHAAVAIQKAAERARGSSAGAFAFRIGIHSGRFMVGQIAGVPQIDHEAKRQAAAVLDGLLAAAEPGAMLVSATVAPLLERRFELTPVGAGDRGQHRAYRLGGREGLGLSRGGRMATFVGRSQEMAVLRSRLEAALRGQGQLVSVVGDAGIGKSRLLFEFRQSLAGERIAYLEGRCLSYGTTMPYLPILDLLRAGYRINELDSPQVIAEKIRRGLEIVGMDPERHAPYLLHLLGDKEATERLATLSPDAIKTHTFEAVRQMSLGSSRNQPLILVVEDLHWIDRTSEQFLASMVNSLPAGRILLLVTYRPGYEPPWANRSFATQLALARLSGEDSLKVAESIVPSGSLPKPIADVILSKAEGNPFFLEELALAVQDVRDVESDLVVPDTVQGVLMTRIERLPEEEQAILQSAAVVGKDLSFPILAAVSGIPEEALRQVLRRLSGAEFLYEMAGYPELKYGFRHGLTHEVAYESLSPARRRALHARILEVTEGLYADRLTEHIDGLAYHALRGQVWVKAFTYLRQAGAQAFARSANREAVAYFERALAALEHLPAGRGTQEQAIDLRLDLRNALLPLGEIDRGLAYLREAETIATDLGDHHRLGQVFVDMTGQHYLTGDYDRAFAYGQHALAITERLKDFGLGIATNAYLGQVCHALGDYERAAEFFRKNVEALVGDLRHERFGLPQPPSIHSRTCLVWALAELGEFREGMTRGEEAIRIAESVDQPLSLTVAYSGLGILCLRKGDLDRAVALLERGLELIRARNIPLWLPRIAAALGYAYALSGRDAEGMPLLEEAVGHGVRMKLVGSHSLLVGWLAEAHRLGGRIAEALVLAREALELARERRERGYEAWALRLGGEIALHSEPVAADCAQEAYDQALALARRLGVRPLVAHCHLGLGRLGRRTGDGVRATTHMAEATARFAELDMRRWAAQAEAELRALG